MTEEEIFNLAAEIFQWVDDEGDIMEGVVTSEQVLEFATKVAQIAHAAGWGEGNKTGSTTINGTIIMDEF
ncbi:MAG: hypothetical protein ACO3CQ_06430 [Candidatus Nanopelagicaceae bacterium]|jgi:hypothetical protein